MSAGSERLFGGLTQAECAALLGISRARVVQIEAKALAKMRRAAKRRGILLEDVLGREPR